MEMHFQGFDHLIVFSRTVFLNGANAKDRKATSIAKAPFKFDMGAMLYPSLGFRPLRISHPLESNGAVQTSSHLTSYEPTVGVFQTVFGIKGGEKKNEAGFRAIYDYLIEIMDNEAAGLYSTLRDFVGPSARFSWSCSIDLVALSDAHLHDTAPNGIVGPYVTADSARRFVAGEIAVKVGPTGTYCYLPPSNHDELNNVMFWLGHAHYSFASLHDTVRTLIEKQSSLSEKRQLGPNQFHDFVDSKIAILNMISRVEPQVLGSRWIDFDVYDQIFRDWDISHLKNVCLELLDRLESIVSGLEEIRVRKNNFAISMLVNVITFTGLFGVLSYFWDFTGRQEKYLSAYGISTDYFLSVEPVGVIGIAAVAVIFSFAAVLRNR